MKVEGLTITCENTAEFMVLAEGVDRVFQYMNRYSPKGDLYNLSYEMREQLDKHIDEEKLK